MTRWVWGSFTLPSLMAPIDFDLEVGMWLRLLIGAAARLKLGEVKLLPAFYLLPFFSSLSSVLKLTLLIVSALPMSTAPGFQAEMASCIPG